MNVLGECTFDPALIIFPFAALMMDARKNPSLFQRLWDGLWRLTDWVSKRRER